MTDNEPRLYLDVEDWERPVECPDCGAAVLNRDKHDRWHLAVKSAITMLDRRMCGHDR